MLRVVDLAGAADSAVAPMAAAVVAIRARAVAFLRPAAAAGSPRTPDREGGGSEREQESVNDRRYQLSRPSMTAS